MILPGRYVQVFPMTMCFHDFYFCKMCYVPAFNDQIEFTWERILMTDQWKMGIKCAVGSYACVVGSFKLVVLKNEKNYI